jgi:hypothetical protein
MRLIVVGLILAVASAAHAATGLLQAIEHHTQPIAARPTINQIGLYQNAALAGGYAWFVNYTDSDLGVTTWSASAFDIAEFNRIFVKPPSHGAPEFMLEVGYDFPLRSRAQFNWYFPSHESGTYESNDDDSTATFTRHVLQGYYAPVITGIEMELAPWVSGPAGWTTTQTVRVFGPVPEPTTWGLAVTCALFAVRTARRHAAGFVGRNGVAP